MDLEGIKLEYLTTRLEKGIRDIFTSQLRAAESNIYAGGHDAEEGRSGALRSALQAAQFSISRAGEGLQIVSLLPEYARFVDMKSHGNRNVYNKHIWGILYKETLQDIKFEFREWVERTYGMSLRELMNKN